MTAITLTLKIGLRFRLDLSPLLPERLAGMSLGEVAAIELQYGNRRLPAGEFFDIARLADGEGLHFALGDRRFDYLGRGLSAGSIRVCGDAGAYAGYRMTGGTITIERDAGIFCGCEMQSGEIRIAGDAGDFVGGALPGNKRGMSGGLIMIQGSAGDRVGDHMRRGVIIIEGNAGAYVASRMTAGTIAVQGKLGRYAGYGMKRGTLLLGQPLQHPLPTFNDCGLHTLGFLPMLLRSRAFQGTSLAEKAGQSVRVRRYAGDHAALGRGEILVLQDSLA